MSFQLPCTCNKVFLMSRCLSAPDAKPLPTSLPQEQAAKTKMLSVVWIQEKRVFSIMHSYFETFCKFTKYQICLLLSRKKAHKKYLFYTSQVREALLYVIIKSLRLCNKLNATFK